MRWRILLLTAAMAPVCLAQSDPFQPGMVHEVQLTATREQWRGIEPARARRGTSYGRGEWLQGPPGKRNGLASAMGIEFHYIHADLTIDKQAFRDVAVRYKGNGTYLNAGGK